MTLTVYADVEQRSPEWHDLRRGTLTASTIGQLLGYEHPSPILFPCGECFAGTGDPCVSLNRKTPTAIKAFHGTRTSRANDAEPRLRVADNDTSRAATNALIAERITGTTEPGYINGDMIRGIEHEPYAVEAYQARTGSKVKACGFMVREGDGWTVGFSPDGLVDDDGLIEVKCPRSKSHIQTHITGNVPAAYMAQLQTGLFVSGRDWIDFVSFYGGLPLFIKRVTPDPDWQEAIAYAAAKFETDAIATTAAYRLATHGLPTTNPVPALLDLEF